MKKFAEKFNVNRKLRFLTTCLCMVCVGISCIRTDDDFGFLAGQDGELHFATSDNYLYVQNNQFIRVFDIQQPDEPVMENSVNIDDRNIWGTIETFFLFGDELFIGTSDGMNLYDVSQPKQPKFLTRYQNFTACDAVTVQDDLMYVVLRSLSFCQASPDVLQVLNISDRREPFLEREYPMKDPHDLFIAGNTLFVAEGQEGYQVIDATSSPELEILYHFPEPQANEVLAFDDILMMAGRDGIYQYRYEPLDTPQFLSKIPILNAEEEGI